MYQFPPRIKREREREKTKERERGEGWRNGSWLEVNQNAGAGIVKVEFEVVKLEMRVTLGGTKNRRKGKKKVEAQKDRRTIKTILT